MMQRLTQAVGQRGNRLDEGPNNDMPAGMHSVAPAAGIVGVERGVDEVPQLAEALNLWHEQREGLGDALRQRLGLGGNLFGERGEQLV